MRVINQAFAITWGPTRPQLRANVAPPFCLPFIPGATLDAILTYL